MSGVVDIYVRRGLIDADDYPSFVEFTYRELYDSGAAGLLIAIVTAWQLPPGQT